MEVMVKYLYTLFESANNDVNMESEISCPICFEEIPADSSNSLQTSCNHKFHTNCFLKHTAVNGYTCPYCRKVLVETAATDDTDVANHDRNLFIHNHSILEEGMMSYEDSDEDNNENSDDDDDDEDEENNDGYEVDPENAMLAPMRWMFQRANDEPLEESNPNLQRFYQYNDSKDRSMSLMREENWMYIKDMLQRLKKQKITEEQILAAYLYQVSHNYRFSTVAFDVNVDLQKKIHYLHNIQIHMEDARNNQNTFSTMAGNGGYYSYDGEED
jgi:hypothetical protein